MSFVVGVVLQCENPPSKLVLGLLLAENLHYGDIIHDNGKAPLVKAMSELVIDAPDQSKPHQLVE